MSKAYGIKEITSFDEVAYNEFVAQIDTTGMDITSLIGEKAQYDSIRRTSTDTAFIKDLSQPIQMLYFKGNDLVSFQANCYAPGGLNKLNWNYDRRFDTFVPKTVHDNGSGKIHLADYIDRYPEITENESKAYTLIITWSLMVEKISRDAIEIALNNVREFNRNHETNVYLINNDDAFAGIK